MLGRLPDFVDPMRLVRQRADLEGSVPLTKMQRLGRLLSATDGEARVALEFGVNEAGAPAVHGAIRASLLLVCQRCLEPVRQDIEVDLNLALASSEAQAESVPDGYDALIVGDSPFSLVELIEDELILALPIVVMHRLEDCPARERMRNESPAAQSPAEPEANPFAILRELKTKH